MQVQLQACKCHMHHSILKKWHLGICKHTLTWSPNWSGTSTSAMLGTGEDTCADAAHSLRVASSAAQDLLNVTWSVHQRHGSGFLTASWLHRAGPEKREVMGPHKEWWLLLSAVGKGSMSIPC